MWEYFTKHGKLLSTFFDDYSKIIFKAKCNQMLQILAIALAQVKPGNTFENLLNKIREIICSLHFSNEIT